MTMAQVIVAEMHRQKIHEALLAPMAEILGDWIAKGRVNLHDPDDVTRAVQSAQAWAIRTPPKPEALPAKIPTDSAGYVASVITARKLNAVGGDDLVAVVCKGFILVGHYVWDAKAYTVAEACAEFGIELPAHLPVITHPFVGSDPTYCRHEACEHDDDLPGTFCDEPVEKHGS